MTENEQPVSAARIYDLASTAATRDLREMYPAQWKLLLDGYRDHYRRELGWKDGRTSANKKRKKEGR